MRCFRYAIPMVVCAVLLTACTASFTPSEPSAVSAERAASVSEISPQQEAEQTARQLADVASAYPITSDFLLWCEEQTGTDLSREFASRLQSGMHYADRWFYDVSGVSLHVLYGRYSGADQQSNWHEMPDSANAPELLFTGDVNLDDDWEIMRNLNASGGNVETAFSPELLARLRGADLLVINHEFPYSLRGQALAGKLYTFCSDPKNTAFLQAMGVDLAGLANNHVFDYGADAFEDTLTALEQAEIPYVGAGRDREQAMQPQYFVLNGLKIAVVAATRAEKFIFTQEATPTQPGVLRTYDPTLFVQAISQAAENSDYVAAYVHWGTENTTVLESEQISQAQQYVDAGADLVVGAHPHCLQGFAYVDGKPVAYSLGNFWFNMNTVKTGVLSVRVTAPGEASVTFVPCLQRGGITSLMEPSDREVLLQQMRELSPGVRIYADGLLEPDGPEL